MVRTPGAPGCSPTPYLCPCPVLLARTSPIGPNPADRAREGLVRLPEAGGADHVHSCPPFKAAPSAPGRVLASRNTRTSVVVQWDRPRQDADLLGYYVDCCVAGSNIWEPCNHKPIGYNRCCAREPRPAARGPSSGSGARTC